MKICLWYEMIHEDWYAIKQRNQTFKSYNYRKTNTHHRQIKNSDRKSFHWNRENNYCNQVFTNEIDLFENYLSQIGILVSTNDRLLLLDRIISVRKEYLKPLKCRNIIYIMKELILYNSVQIIETN